MRILFLDILTGDPELRKKINKTVYGGGTYGESMRKTFGLKKSEWAVIDASKNLPRDFKKFDAVIIGGSTEDPIRGREKPWVKKTYAAIRKIIKNKIPFLGICGGLQFSARALGGEIILNPKGREFGNVKITQSPAGKNDFLFAGLPNTFIVQGSHKCIVKKILPGWRLLGSSNLCNIQAVAVGDCARLLQFHPEMGLAEIKRLAKMRRVGLIAEGFVKDEKDFKKFLSSIKNTEAAGKKILNNFVKFVKLHNQ